MHHIGVNNDWWQCRTPINPAAQTDTLQLLLLTVWLFERANKQAGCGQLLFAPMGTKLPTWKLTFNSWFTKQQNVKIEGHSRALVWSIKLVEAQNLGQAAPGFENPIGTRWKKTQQIPWELNLGYDFHQGNICDLTWIQSEKLQHQCRLSCNLVTCKFGIPIFVVGTCLAHGRHYRAAEFFCSFDSFGKWRGPANV